MDSEPAAVRTSSGEQRVFYGGQNGALYFWFWNDHEWELEWMGETMAL